MRDITIFREESRAGKKDLVSFYITDPRGEIRLDGTPCRLLGTLSQGEEKTFSLEECPGTLFSAGDPRLTCTYDTVELPEGQEPLYFRGRCFRDPATENSFRFRNGAGEESALIREADARKKKKRNITLLVTVLVLLALGLCVGLLLLGGDGKPQESRTVTMDRLSIELPEKFELVQGTEEGPQAAYQDGRASVMLTRVDWEDYPEYAGLTLREFYDKMMERMKVTDEAYHEKDGQTYLQVSVEQEGRRFALLSFAFRTEDAFWLVDCSTPTGNFRRYEDRFHEWASTVTLSE